MADSRTPDNNLNLPAWGGGGMDKITPLWLLKYLPNMLSCHVSIIHDTQGPSNCITCHQFHDRRLEHWGNGKLSLHEFAGKAATTQSTQ